MALDLKLKADGTLLEPLEEGTYSIKTEKTEDVLESREIDGIIELERVITTTTVYYLGTTRDALTFTYKEEILRKEAEFDPAPVVEANTNLVNMIGQMRQDVQKLIEGLPLKNASQREYALAVALTDRAFAFSYQMLPDKYKDSVIQ